MFVVGLLLITNSAFAESPTIITSQTETIKQLKEQIQLLQTQIVDLKTEVQSVKKELEFTRVLAKGAKGEDVKQLQEFLKNFTGVYPNGSTDGRFGPLTANAVKKFQKQNGINPIGTVGPKTQEKLKMLNDAIPTVTTTPANSIQPNGQTITTPVITPAIPGELTTSAIPPTGTELRSLPTTATNFIPATPCKTPTKTEIQSTFIKVLSPNGGEQWKIGGTYTIKYSAKDIALNKALLIYLEKGYDAPSTKTGVNSGTLIGITTNLESYTYTVPSNISGWPGLGNNYQIKIMVEGYDASCGGIPYIGDSSDEKFSIVAGQQVNTVTTTPTGAPAISGGSTTFGGSINSSAVGTSSATTGGGGYGKEDKARSLFNKIDALQNQLKNITDEAKKASLMTQITELKAQVKAYQASFDTTTSVIIIPVMTMSDAGFGQHYEDKNPATAASMLTNQGKINALVKETSALHYQLDNATDETMRASLRNKITELEKQEQTLRDKISAISKQISILQTQLNNTTDMATRNFLTNQITELKIQMEYITLD